jgi:hypothetical protein
MVCSRRLTSKYTAECLAVHHIFLFDPKTTKTQEIAPSCRDLVKDIDSGNAASLAV